MAGGHTTGTVLQRSYRVLYRVYFGMGAVMIGAVAALTIFTVFARYLFSRSWKELSEFITICFALSTFWGMGVCMLRDGHVAVDLFSDRLGPIGKRLIDGSKLLVCLAVMVLFVRESFSYTMMAGAQASHGMGVPMYYIYGIMPVTGTLCILCILIRLAILIMDIPDPLAPDPKR